MADDGSQQRKHLRSPTVLAAIGVAATLVLALVVVITLLLTGGADAVTDNAALIGALVALGGVFTAQMVSIALDDRRTEESRELEAQRAHETALQNYFEQVGTLLIEQPLRRASPGENLSTVVRAQTLAVLEGLDPDRKRILLQFLYESGLIYKNKPVVSLVLANLSKANLSGANLSEANLFRANLSGANLYGTDLYEANLKQANLFRADLRGADDGGGLIGADLRGANLSEANLTKANLLAALMDDTVGDGNQVQLKGPVTHLERATLLEANLQNARLSKARLEGARLEGAHLEGTDLSGAKGITTEELEQQAKSLKGAIMPDGSKHH